MCARFQYSLLEMIPSPYLSSLWIIDQLLDRKHTEPAKVSLKPIQETMTESIVLPQLPLPHSLRVGGSRSSIPGMRPQRQTRFSPTVKGQSSVVSVGFVVAGVVSSPLEQELC